MELRWALLNRLWRMDLQTWQLWMEVGLAKEFISPLSLSIVPSSISQPLALSFSFLALRDMHLDIANKKRTHVWFYVIWSFSIHIQSRGVMQNLYDPTFSTSFLSWKSFGLSSRPCSTPPNTDWYFFSPLNYYLKKKQIIKTLGVLSLDKGERPERGRRLLTFIVGAIMCQLFNIVLLISDLQNQVRKSIPDW